MKGMTYMQPDLTFRRGTFDSIILSMEKEDIAGKKKKRHFHKLKSTFLCDLQFSKNIWFHQHEDCVEMQKFQAIWVNVIKPAAMHRSKIPGEKC